MDSIKVKDVFSKGFVSIHGDAMLSSCLHLFKEKKLPVLVVLNKDDKYQGVIARRWIIRSRRDPSVTKVSSLMRQAPTVSLHDSLGLTARLMLESEIRQLPIYSGKKLEGFVTDNDIIRKSVLTKWGETKVESIMTSKPFTINENDSIGSVISLFREKNISHAPVVTDQKLVGIVSIHDVIINIFQPRQRQTRGENIGEKVPVLSISVKGIMTKPVITVLPENKLKDAEEEMRRFKISSLVVVDKGRPIGILTKRDFLEPLTQEEKKARGMLLQFSVKSVEIDNMQKNFIMDDFKSFSKKYVKTLEGGTLFVYLKTHGSNLKEEQLIHCRLQLRSKKGSFFSSSEGWGVERTFQIALDRLERQVLSCKEVRYDPELAKNYLARINFPYSEL